MNSPQLAVTGAFLVIGVLILARHATWVSSAITWVAAPVRKGGTGG
jgi:hypothetical protein